jgi:hypothetical protein
MSQVQDRFLSEEYQASTGRLVRETQVGGEKKKSHAMQVRAGRNVASKKARQNKSPSAKREWPETHTLDLLLLLFLLEALPKTPSTR